MAKRTTDKKELPEDLFDYLYKGIVWIRWIDCHFDGFNYVFFVIVCL